MAVRPTSIGARFALILGRTVVGQAWRTYTVSCVGVFHMLSLSVVERG